MAIVPFERPRKIQSSLCRNGHHKWRVDKTRRFDVKQGRLVTLYRCERCGREKVSAD
jgi:hypothetical protein